jgi:hypothetical protein
MPRINAITTKKSIESQGWWYAPENANKDFISAPSNPPRLRLRQPFPAIPQAGFQARQQNALPCRLDLWDFTSHNIAWLSTRTRTLDFGFLSSLWFGN